MSLRVLIGCEFSGIVCEAFNAQDSVRAWSCDYEPREDGRYENHLDGDVLPRIRTTSPDSENWNLIGLHYTCTYFCNSGVRWLYKRHADGRSGHSHEIEPVRWEKMVESAKEFANLWKAAVDSGAAVYFENPTMHSYAASEIDKALRGWKGPSPFADRQAIDPRGFGHPETKKTWLHLHKLPHLTETNRVYNEAAALTKGQRARVHYASPGPNRWKERSRTLPGIAAAMAAQWTAHLIK